MNHASVGSKPKLVVLGTMCRDPVAGMVWLYLHHLVGLQRLGYDVHYVEWHGRWVAHPEDASVDADTPRVLVGEVLRRFGFGDRWICRADHVSEGFTYGPLSRAQLYRLYGDAEAIINVTGSHYIEDEQLQCPRRVYLETDPGLPQARLSAGQPELTALVARHTHFLTWAANLGGRDCLLPETGLDYHLTRQPIVPDLWEAGSPARPCFTTISKWEKRGKNLDLDGETYRWSKHYEFLKFLDLPSRTSQPLELALSGIGDEDRNVLRGAGWSVTDALAISSSLDGYRSYIQASRGEFTIAKDQYTRLRTGWFSDRSACYLAAGRPVVTQDTGFDCALPTGEGLFAFRTADEAAAAFTVINRDYERHSRAARRLAAEYFGYEPVLGDILQSIGLPRRAAEREPAAVGLAT